MRDGRAPLWWGIALMVSAVAVAWRTNALKWPRGSWEPSLVFNLLTTGAAILIVNWFVEGLQRQRKEEADRRVAQEREKLENTRQDVFAFVGWNLALDRLRLICEAFRASDAEWVREVARSRPGLERDVRKLRQTSSLINDDFDFESALAQTEAVMALEDILRYLHTSPQFGRTWFTLRTATLLGSINHVATKTNNAGLQALVDDIATKLGTRPDYLGLRGYQYDDIPPDPHPDL